MHEKEIEKLQAEKGKVKRQLAQEQHKIQWFENRAAYYEKGARAWRAHEPRAAARCGAAFEMLQQHYTALALRKTYLFIPAFRYRATAICVSVTASMRQ